MEKQVSYRKKEGDEIDLLAYLKNLWEQRRIIYRTLGVFLVLGLLFVVLAQREFTASSTFLPQTENAGGGGRLGGLASIAGINLGGAGSTSEIPPSLYPKIINSVNFRRALLDTPISVDEGQVQTTYREYYEELHSPGALTLIYRYTLGLPGTIRKAFRSDETESETLPQNAAEDADLIRISGSEVKHFGRLKDQLEVIPDSKEGTVELKFVMPEPLMAAQMANAAKALLQQELINYKIRNAREQMKFTESQYQEKREEFIAKQRELARFRDRNQNISSAMAMNELQRLEAEYNFAFNIYTELAKQLEEAKLKVSKDTPVFAVLDPVTVPTAKSAPKTLMVLFNFLLVGFIIGVGTVIVRQYLGEFKKQWATV